MFLYTDGGSRGNPGNSAIAYFLIEDVEVFDFGGKFLGTATNNTAEYTALIEGLNLAVKHEIKEIDCVLDSELVVKQLNGEYKVSNADIKKLYDKVIYLKKNFKRITFTHVLRNKNKLADRLVNIILDTVEKSL